jgi:predicted GNAT family acetyltransferase
MSYPIQHDADAHQFTATVESQLSLLQYRLKDGVMKIVHTAVPAAFAGHGIAGDLMRAALETARSNGWRVVPACSYALAFFERHPEYSDLLAERG